MLPVLVLALGHARHQAVQRDANENEGGRHKERRSWDRQASKAAPDTADLDGGQDPTYYACLVAAATGKAGASE